MRRVAWIMPLALLLIACGSIARSQPAGDVPRLLVSDGTQQTAYTQAELRKLPTAEAEFKDVAYRGVPLSALLRAAGFDAQAIRAVKVIATDGYSMNYDPAVFRRQDVLIAFARADGPLTAEDGSFRMVIPGAEGKLNVRSLVEVKVIP